MGYLGTGADTSGLVDLAAGADKSRWVDLAAGANKSDRWTCLDNLAAEVDMLKWIRLGLEFI